MWATQVLGIPGDGAQGLGDGPEQHAVEEALVLQREWTEAVRQLVSARRIRRCSSDVP